LQFLISKRIIFIFQLAEKETSDYEDRLILKEELDQVENSIKQVKTELKTELSKMSPIFFASSIHRIKNKMNNVNSVVSYSIHRM
jgi:hypothetical protein